MQIGYIGLGKMDKNMIMLMAKKNRQVVVYNRQQSLYREFAGQKNIITVKTKKELVEALRPPRTIWMMMPQEHVESTLKKLEQFLIESDTIIDASNSHYQNTLKRQHYFYNKGINYMDVGVSGGPSAEPLKSGACMFVGGTKNLYLKYKKLFTDLCVKNGFAYMGQTGAGHYVKTIHNGIQYGMMQSIAEGFDLMNRTKEFNLNIKEIARVYNNGSLIESKLMGWMARGLEIYGENLTKVSGQAGQSWEAKWTVDLARKLKMPATIIEESLKSRLRSQKRPNYQGKVITLLRNQFGGHSINAKK